MEVSALTSIENIIGKGKDAKQFAELFSKEEYSIETLLLLVAAQAEEENQHSLARTIRSLVEKSNREWADYWRNR